MTYRGCPGLWFFGKEVDLVEHDDELVGRDLADHQALSTGDGREEVRRSVFVRRRGGTSSDVVDRARLGAGRRGDAPRLFASGCPS